MTPHRLIVAAIVAWTAWRNRKALYRSVPALRAVDMEITKARQSHKPVRPLEAKRQQIMNAALRGEAN